MAQHHLTVLLCALLPNPAGAETKYTVGAFIRPADGKRAALEQRAHHLADVDSPSYGRYLSQEDLAEAIGVPTSVANQVGLWLVTALQGGEQSQTEPRVLAHRDAVTLAVPNFTATYDLGRIIEGKCPHCPGAQLVHDTLPSSLELLVTPPMPPDFCEDLTSAGRSMCEAHPPCKWKEKNNQTKAECKGSFAGWFCWPEAKRTSTKWTCFEPAELLYGDSPLPRRRRRGRRWLADHGDQHSPGPSNLGFRAVALSEGLMLLYNGSANHGRAPQPFVDFSYRQNRIVHTNRLFSEGFVKHGASGWLATSILGLTNLRPVDGMAVCLAANATATELGGRVACECGSNGIDKHGGRRCQVLGGDSPSGTPIDFVVPRGTQTLSALQRDLDIPSGTFAHEGATQAVAEFTDEAFMQKDLVASHVAYGLEPPQKVRVEGPDGTPGEPDDFATAGEGSLDVQVIAALAPGGNTTWVAVDPYCLDGFMLAYACHLNHHSSPPLVHSISWGDAEALYPPEFVKRLDYELMKLAMRGLSILISSGDNGISSTTPDCLHGPDLAGSSPWVTSVGATLPSLAAAPFCDEPAFERLGLCEEPGPIACATTAGSVITSSGYWSLYRDRPSYQDEAVEAYMRSAACNPCLTGYKASEEATVPCQHLNKSGCSLGPLVGAHRGSPDVALPGANYPVLINLTLGLEDGTSASTPAFAAMVSLLNSEQLSRGRPPLGFLNPWLYRTFGRHPEAFQDVLVGDIGSTETNVCPHGWRAAPGWDVASGLGVPLFSRLKQHLPTAEAATGKLAEQLSRGEEALLQQALLPRGGMALLLPCLGTMGAFAALAAAWKALRQRAEPGGSGTLSYVAMSRGPQGQRLLSA